MARLHEVLDVAFDPSELMRLLDAGTDVEARNDAGETPLHIAVRRYRQEATRILLDRGADINARTPGGKTAFAHAVRRGFDDLAAWLLGRGATCELADADRLAVLFTHGDLIGAASLLERRPELARTGNPEEDRLLADLAGRSDEAAVRMLIDAGADLSARGLDEGTPLHQTAWFGQPANTRLLIDAGSPLDIFEPVHHSNALGWATHGSRYSGEAELRQPAYVAVTRMLLEAGSATTYPDDDSDAFRERMLEDASPAVRDVLEEFLG